MFTVQGNYNELIAKLFHPIQDGTLQFGAAAKSRERLSAPQLTEWAMFIDYVMEGFVSYWLRATDAKPGLILEIRLTGTNRDQFVAWSVKHAIESAGFEVSSTDV